jgi:hypothetical protein
MSKFKKLLDNIEVLTEDAKSSIQEAFEAAVNSKVEERVKLEVDNALSKIDEQHAASLTTLLEKVDEDHAKKFKIALQKLDEDHTKKLQNVVEHYENALKKDSIALREELENDISEFLDVYIENSIPTKEIRKAVENTQATRLLESIRQIVSVDERYINNNIKEALKDGKDKMISFQKKLNEQVKDNIELAKENRKLDAKLLLQEKTIDMPSAKKSFVYKLLESKSPEYIKSNFNYVVEMFEKDDDAPSKLINESRKQRPNRTYKRVAESVDTPEILEESNKGDAPSSPAAEYLKMLQSQEVR